MRKTEKCALCGRYVTLLSSHVIPKFAVTWLKRSSATSYLRQGTKPNVPKQDIDRLTLLCSDCENRLSKWEKRFAENIFVRFHEGNQESFEYREWLLLFAVSLSWRTVIKEIESFREHNPKLITFVENALGYWNPFLLNKSADSGPYDHHIFFLDYVAEANQIELPDKINWYLLRSIDSAIVCSSQEVFAYTLLPGIIFWSGIQPPKPEGWEGTLISKEGVTGTPQCAGQPVFAEFLRSRAKLALKLMTAMSERQHTRINRSVLINPEKAIRSRSFETFLAGEFLKRQKTDNARQED